MIIQTQYRITSLSTSGFNLNRFIKSYFSSYSQFLIYMFLNHRHRPILGFKAHWNRINILFKNLIQKFLSWITRSHRLSLIWRVASVFNPIKGVGSKFMFILQCMIIVQFFKTSSSLKKGRPLSPYHKF